MDHISKSYDRISFPFKQVRSGEPKEAREMFGNDQQATQVGPIW